MRSTPSSRAVPPVETSSTPSSWSPRPKSTRPRLGERVSSARRTRTSSGGAGSMPLDSVASAIDPDQPGVVRVRLDPARRDQTNRLRKQAVFDAVDALLDSRDVGRVGELEGFLQDDRSAVDSLVDEVDGHAHHLDSVLERLLDGSDAGKGGQERGVHVDDPAPEAGDEVRAEQLHESREHDEL